MARIYLKKTLSGLVAADEPSASLLRKYKVGEVYRDTHGRNPSKVSTGQKFGRLTVVRLARVGADRQRRYECRCLCGKTVEVRTSQLTKGRTKSCGCLRLENPQNKTHGMSRKSNRTYRIWMGMRDRCNRTNSPVYKYYGGRGITVCDRWNSFENFLADMGEAPRGLSIDRTDNNKGYSPDNCRWATQAQQVANRRPNGSSVSP